MKARHKEILTHIHNNPGISLTRLYVDTSPACQRKGLTRSFGTNNWTIPETLRKLGYITVTPQGTRRTEQGIRTIPARLSFKLTLLGEVALEREGVVL